MTAPKRILVTLLVILLTAISANMPAAQAIQPPSIDPHRVPADGKPGPDQPMRQSNVCARTITVADPNVAVLAPGFAMLNISKAWEYSTGNGVVVAVIDTGVNPSARLPVIAGGDYITGGDGLMDCDAHGTIVASVIGAAPQGTPMPAPMPKAPAFPPPPGSPPTNSAPPPPGAPPPPAAVPTPTPVTITETKPPPPPPPADEPANGPGDPTPDSAEDPEVPPPPPGAPDGIVGVAPHATILSIRQSSRAYEPVRPAPGDEARRKAGTIATLASAIVHAANMGAKVINVSVTSCVPAADSMDQSEIGAAVWYAATVKDAVIIAAAGNEGEQDCAQNPSFDPLDAADPRDWHHVKTISSPSWFADYVLSVGAVDNTGAPLGKSLAGPWVAAAAPGVAVMGLSPQTGGPANAYPPIRLGEKNMPFWGTSFSAAYVSGIAALVRAKYPELSAHQVINRILQTAHNPPRGVDNHLGYGVVDPLAALTFHVPPGDRVAPGAQSRVLHPAPPPLPPDHRARTMALAFTGLILAIVLASLLANRVRRAR